MIRVGIGFDAHPFDPARSLVLGGITIPESPGLAGHSDADIVAHAVADAVLGAAGLPALGELFPAGDERHRDASSLGLLGEVADRVARERWWVANVDVVLAADQPHLAPHVPAMAANLASALGPASEPLGPGVHVSVKPKRTEGLGFVGRAEGMAAWAVALLERG